MIALKSGKYLIVSNEYGSEVPILFPESLAHNEVKGNFFVMSAGSFQFILDNNEIKVHTGGGSMTLNIKSREKDKDIIKQYFLTEQD